MSPSRISAMIQANVAAVNAGRITWEQFSRVNSATWDLVYDGELPVIGSRASNRSARVLRELDRARA